MKAEMTPDPLMVMETEKVQNTQLGAHRCTCLECGEAALRHTGYLHCPTPDIQKECPELLKD